MKPYYAKGVGEREIQVLKALMEGDKYFSDLKEIVPSSSQLANILKKLEKRDQVIYELDPKDRRRKLYKLSENSVYYKDKLDALITFAFVGYYGNARERFAYLDDREYFAQMVGHGLIFSIEGVEAGVNTEETIKAYARLVQSEYLHRESDAGRVAHGELLKKLKESRGENDSKPKTIKDALNYIKKRDRKRIKKALML